MTHQPTRCIGVGRCKWAVQHHLSLLVDGENSQVWRFCLNEVSECIGEHRVCRSRDMQGTKCRLDSDVAAVSMGTFAPGDHESGVGWSPLQMRSANWVIRV